ncbi:MAG: ABC transporter permease subunit [Acidimicrobiia bacterium]
MPAVRQGGFQLQKRRWLVATLFLAPALLVLGALVVYPAFDTIRLSLYDRFGDEFVGFDNYRRMFRLDRIRTALRNSLIWVAVFPFFVTTVGLALAVLSEKIKWRSAFRLILFIPAAIAVLSSGIIWRFMYDANPDTGLLNALANVPVAIFNPEGDYPGAAASYDGLIQEEPGGAIAQVVQVGPDGGVATLGVLRLTEAALPAEATEASTPSPAGSGTITGVVWRDTTPGDNIKGVIDPTEKGIPGVTVEIIDPAGTTVEKVRSAPDGSFETSGLDPGTYRVEIPESTFREAWGGINWLGEDLITISAMIAGIWIWGGFALLVIAAGLASLPQDVLEAARVDGATEWQVFRRVTVPLLKPIITVVFIALTINALKMFDLIIGIAPGSVQDDANVIALEMWRTAFTGLGDRGMGSAIAVFLFLMILPILAFNIRRFRLEGET